MILLAAAIARLAGIGYLHFPDEAAQLYRSLKIGAGEFMPNWFVGVYSYFMFLWYGGFFVLGRLGGLFPSLEGFMGSYYTDPHVFYVAGRAAECLAGTGGVYCLYLLGRRLFSRPVGLAAAAFLALNVTHVEISQVARGQAFALLCGLLALLMGERYRRKPTVATGIWIGIFLAAGVSIRIYYLAYVLPVLLVILYPRRGSPFPLFCKGAAAGAVSFVVFSCLFTPELVFDLPRLVSGMSNAIIPLAAPEESNFLGAEVSNPLRVYLFSFLPLSLGWPLYLAALAGLAAAIARIKEMRYGLVGILPVVYVMVMGRSDLAAPRYLLPIYPMLFLGAAELLAASLRGRGGGRTRPVLLAAAVLLLSVPGLTRVVALDLDRNRLQTIDLAKAWILANVPDRAGVAVESTGYSGPNIRLYSVIDYDVYRLPPEELRALYAERAKSDPGGSRALKYFIDHPPRPWHRVYDLNVKRPVSVDYLLEEGVEYVVTSSGVRKDYLGAHAEAKFPNLVRNRLAFYDWVERNGELVATFAPSSHHPGPEIKVFRILRDRLKTEG